ncbi:hypothetical protein RCS94_04440 [Orbaceae bacterium ac157xtp]
MLIAPNSYGALSATSANTIKGSAPSFTGQSGANKLGFKVGSILYSEREGNIVGGTEKIFEPSLRLNEFEVQSLTVNDFRVSTDYYDADGDDAHPTTPFTVGSLIYNWYDRNGTEITDYTKMVGCSGLSHPLTLKISLPAQAHSMYGDPKESSSVPLTKEYKITTVSGICFAKPNSMWDFGGIITPSGGGYTKDFVPDYGFKATPIISTLKFPTTGFPGAQFKLIMTGNASNYTFSSNTSAVVVDNTVANAGTVTLNSKPSKPVTIKVKLNNSSPVIEHEYTFDPRTVWVVPKGFMNYASAKSTCGASRIPARAQLTNSPSNTGAVIISQNSATRAIGGGIFGEWGDTTSISYPNSSWASFREYYWTKEAYSSTYQFVVNNERGFVSRTPNNSSNSPAVCVR